MRSRKDAMADDDPGDDPGDDRQGSGPWRSLVGLALIAVLILGVWFVMQQLRHAASLQDCVASGRTNCVPITPER
jgi:hypothetical protein